MADERIRENLNREDLAEVESVLATLAPRASRVDRDRLMFLAGQASVRPLQVDGSAVAAPPLTKGGPGGVESLLATVPPPAPLCSPPLRGGTAATEWRATEGERCADARASAWWMANRAARRRWVWPVATIVSTTVAIVLACLLALRPQVDAAPQVVYRVEYVERSADEDDRPLDGQDAADRVEPPVGVAASDRDPVAEPHRLDDRTGFDRTAFGRNEFRSRFPALALNVDALPTPQYGGSAAPSEPATYRAMLRDLLDEQQPAVPQADAADSGTHFFDWSFFTPRGESS